MPKRMLKRKKSIALKTNATKEDSDDENNEDGSDEEMPLIVRGLKRFMKKKKFGKKG